jgi:hypothetical protein
MVLAATNWRVLDTFKFAAYWICRKVCDSCLLPHGVANAARHMNYRKQHSDEKCVAVHVVLFRFSKKDQVKMFRLRYQRPPSQAERAVAS